MNRVKKNGEGREGRHRETEIRGRKKAMINKLIRWMRNIVH
jgi:hypothetical protein